MSYINRLASHQRFVFGIFNTFEVFCKMIFLSLSRILGMTKYIFFWPPFESTRCDRSHLLLIENSKHNEWNVICEYSRYRTHQKVNLFELKTQSIMNEIFLCKYSRYRTSQKVNLFELKLKALTLIMSDKFPNVKYMFSRIISSHLS